MTDNRTSSPAAGYDTHVSGVNPHYSQYHADTIDVVGTIVPHPVSWLDSGGGTGTLVLKALEFFPETAFTLADPSKAMLEIAAEKLMGKGVGLVMKGTQELDFPNHSFDVITAIQSHHYFDAKKRRAATENCFRMLKGGGVYVTFENIRPFTKTGLEVGMGRWKRYQLGKGRSPDEVEKHLKRFDSEFFPITAQQHLDLLRDSGFSVVEILFAGLMQAGFYAIKAR